MSEKGSAAEAVFGGGIRVGCMAPPPLTQLPASGMRDISGQQVLNAFLIFRFARHHAASLDHHKLNMPILATAILGLVGVDWC